MANRPVLLTGATGYIGGRLLPLLLERGWRVRAAVRQPEKLRSRPWASHPALELVRADVQDAGSLSAAVRGCRACYYLVHSMGAGVGDFAYADRRAARHMAQAAEAAGLERLVYLTGLGTDDAQLSEHLRSRAEVESILRSGQTPVTALRAAMIIGAGSASFEILRYLVDRLPLMIAPRWVDTPCQPIGVRNVLHYLLGALEHPAMAAQTYDIGQEQIVTYRQLMRIYAEEAALRRRLIVGVPLLTPHLSSYWIHLVTPVPAYIARPLAEGLRNEVICRDDRIRRLLPQPLLDCRQAIGAALESLRNQQVQSSWSDAGVIPPVEWIQPGEPDWVGGTVFTDARRIRLRAEPDRLWRAVTQLGGTTGWYYADWLWRLRGGLDRLLGGVGLARGRRDGQQLHAGDALDFWRVVRVDAPERLLLAAEMKLPGEAVLEFRLRGLGDGELELQQIARFRPHGLGGLAYWWAVTPLHHPVFQGMLRGIARAAGGTVTGGPESFRPEL